VKELVKVLMSPFKVAMEILSPLWEDPEFVFGLGFVFGLIAMLFVLILGGYIGSFAGLF
jgi:hypothetical protein